MNNIKIKFDFNLSNDKTCLWCEKIYCSDGKRFYDEELDHIIWIYNPFRSLFSNFDEVKAIKSVETILKDKLQEKTDEINIKFINFCIQKDARWLKSKLQINFETTEQAEYFYIFNKINPIYITLLS